MSAYAWYHQTAEYLRDKFASIRTTSNFRATGEITPEEFLAAGDFLVYKFPSWSWSDASSPSKRVPHLPEGKQFLVTRGVPSHRRLNGANARFAGEAGETDTLVRDGFGGAKEGDDEGWLRTGAMAESQEARVREVRTIDGSGKVGEIEEDEEIPDMEDEEDDEEAIIPESRSGKDADTYVETLSAFDATFPCSNLSSETRTYTLYITYSPYYRTPRMYLSGYHASGQPLKPQSMMEDIVGDYKDKTVTLEDFPFFDAGLKMASVHPCKHASVMKILLDRADSALKLRMAKIKQGKGGDVKVGGITGLEGLEDEVQALRIGSAGDAKSKEGEEWEVLDQPEGEDEIAIRVDQYLVVFLKFMASVTPGIEHDYTMGV